MQDALPIEVSNVYVCPSGKYDINSPNGAVGTDSWHWNMNDMLNIGKEIGEIILTKIV